MKNKTLVTLVVAHVSEIVFGNHPAWFLACLIVITPKWNLNKKIFENLKNLNIKYLHIFDMIHQINTNVTN